MIIGFTGKMGTGKSTAIEVIKSAAGHNVVLNKFAQPIYNIQEAVYKEISPVYQRDITFVKDRKLLQWIGTDWARDTISKTLWVDLWQAKARLIQETNPNAVVVCDDVRFDNEAETIIKSGGTVIQLVGPTRGAEEGIKFHSSESGIDQKLVHYFVHNDKSKDQFKDEIFSLFEKLKTLKLS